MTLPVRYLQSNKRLDNHSDIFLFYLGCLERKKQFHTDPIGDSRVPFKESPQTAFGCQKLCQNSPACLAFQFYEKPKDEEKNPKGKGICILKSKITDTKNAGWRNTVGLKHCPQGQNHCQAFDEKVGNQIRIIGNIKTIV